MNIINMHAHRIVVAILVVPFDSPESASVDGCHDS